MINNNESMIVCDKVSSLFLALHIRTTENDRYITFNGTYFSFKTFVNLNVLSHTNFVAINSNSLFQKGNNFPKTSFVNWNMEPDFSLGNTLFLPWVQQLRQIKWIEIFQFREYSSCR